MKTDMDKLRELLTGLDPSHGGRYSSEGWTDAIVFDVAIGMDNSAVIVMDSDDYDTLMKRDEPANER